jgi:hypothetical protein
MHTNPIMVIAAASTTFWLTSLCAPAQAQEIFEIRPNTFDAQVQYRNVKIPPGGEIVLADLKGPGKVTYFYITDSAKELDPGLVLRAFWDNEAEPSINVPLASFFGTFEQQTIDHQSAMNAINHRCNMSFLPMPFSTRALVLLVNDGRGAYARRIAYGIDYEKGGQYAGEKSRLHAMWRRSNPTKDAVHVILNASGRGHYVGNYLHVNTAFKGWWGEGDTTFELDGKRITHTPGVEDEYGSTWKFEHLYTYLYTGYIQMEKGKNRMYRWYVPNPVRFLKSLRVEVQAHHNVTPLQPGNPDDVQQNQKPSSDDYMSIAFWYQEDPHSPFTLQPFAERTAAPRLREE